MSISDDQQTNQKLYYTGEGDDHIAILGGSESSVLALPDLRADLVLFLRLSAMCLDLKAGDATIVQWWTCGDDPQQVRLNL
jgi:hypothetical protein